jgi:hypothetical protein
MKLIPRHRQQRSRAPRIDLTQEEITADLHYPARPRPQRRDAAGKRPGAR